MIGFLSNWSWFLDGWVVAAGILAALSASLLGNFLVLRRMSMLGDAISHAVLPGLAAAFFLSSSRNSLPMFIGAVIVGILTAFFTEWIRGVGEVDEGASMGVVFTSLFALGLVMIVQAADHVDLDPGCVLYGAIELTPLDTVKLFGIEIPRAVVTLGAVTLLNGLFVLCFYKELKLSSFDPALATTSGFNSSLIHYALMTLVAITAVASFESVGNILVVAMFVVPPAAAYMLTDRLPIMIGLSSLVAISSAILGHLAAITIPSMFGFRSTTTAGMIAVATGVFLMLAVLFAPRHGVLVKIVRQQILSLKILADDIVALLYRAVERSSADEDDDSAAIELSRVGIEEMKDLLLADSLSLRIALAWLKITRCLESTRPYYQLSEIGIHRAEDLVRSHRLWEQYLFAEAGVAADQLHTKAEKFEHYTDVELRSRLERVTGDPTVDPHGKPIPAERNSDSPK